MAHIPDSVRWSAVIPSLRHHLIYQGKVRDTYSLPGAPTIIAQRASDRLSIFDELMPYEIPGKGQNLTCIAHYFFTQVLGDLPHHLIQPHSRQASELVKKIVQEHPDIPLSSTLFVYKAQVFQTEMIFRAMLGGSVFKKNYLATGMVAGVKLPAGIPKWTKLPEPLWTPSTKATDGHDENITQEEGRKLLGIHANSAVRLCAEAYKRAYDYAESKGFLLLDSKMEVGIITGYDGEDFLGLVDEVFTPDASRYTTSSEHEFALTHKTEPKSHDKERVRHWGRSIETPLRDKEGKLIKGLDKLDPNNPEHLAFIAQIPPPTELIAEVSDIYRQTAETLIGTTVKDYSETEMMF